MLANDSLYHDQTVFDQLLSWSKLRLAHALPKDREQRWGGIFLGFSLFLGSIAVFLLVSTLFQDTRGSAGAHALSALSLLFAVRFFLITGQRLLAPEPIPEPLEKTKPQPPSVIHAGRSPSAGTRPAQARQFFKAVRDAGVNVKIARALYAGGIQSAEDLNAISDTRLLGIHGVGPATVRKLRGHFNFIEEYYEV